MVYNESVGEVDMHIHSWSLWGAPINATWEGKVWGRIQDRTCYKCGRYQWREV